MISGFFSLALAFFLPFLAFLLFSLGSFSFLFGCLGFLAFGYRGFLCILSAGVFSLRRLLQRRRLLRRRLPQLTSSAGASGIGRQDQLQDRFLLGSALGRLSLDADLGQMTLGFHAGFLEVAGLTAC